MYEIVTKETVAPNIIHMKFKAPKIASSAKPGQFVIIRVDENEYSTQRARLIWRDRSPM